MARTLRSDNMELLRCIHGGHKFISKKLDHITNSNYVSKMATGDMDMTDSMARNIESTLKYPSGWLDRENKAILKLEHIDYEIIMVLKNASLDSKKGLLQFISQYSKNR